MVNKLFLIIFVSISLNASSTKFANKMNYFVNYENAVKYSNKINKPIMLIVVTSTCPWCKKLENQTLKKKHIDKLIKKDFVPLIQNRNLNNFPKDKYNAKVVPTTFFINTKKDQLLHTSYGYKAKKDFIKELQTAKNNNTK